MQQLLNKYNVCTYTVYTILAISVFMSLKLCNCTYVRTYNTTINSLCYCLILAVIVYAVRLLTLVSSKHSQTVHPPKLSGSVFGSLTVLVANEHCTGKTHNICTYTDTHWPLVIHHAILLVTDIHTYIRHTHAHVLGSCLSKHSFGGHSCSSTQLTVSSIVNQPLQALDMTISCS